ncbi:hypothetical protein CERSUDRAFT_117925 [Gelatoporia subvermispora B]|uniref:Uncharacterized protein n=1 Tax=Ceriporiopsis subvermispora (strain B) TaxID=914234 RepID=M2R533_CERS8|nr:hypothetical protein CERSUDRAFT_117925 [Gelatoporia subvermispora B]
MRLSVLISALALGVLSVLGQTITTTDDLGETVVEVITTDPVLLIPTTEILETITGPSTTALSTPALSTPAVSTPAAAAVPTTPAAQQVQQGPVGAPPPTPAVQEPTVYTYTTTDGNGDTVALTAIFTPTSPAALTHSTTAGTILQYSQWLSLIGTNTVPATTNAAAPAPLSLEHRWFGMAAGTLVGVLGGAWLVLA